MTATLETLPVEILQEIATCLLPLAKDFTYVHKLRLTSRTIKAKVHRIFLLGISKQRVPIKPRCLNRLYRIVHHEEFGAAVKRVAWMFGPTHPLHVPREGYEPLQDNRYDGRSEDDEFKAILDSQIQTVVWIPIFMNIDTQLNAR